MESSYPLDPENGFEELYDTLELELEEERAELQAEIYRRVEETFQSADVESDSVVDNPEALESFGNVVASHYAGLIELFEEGSVIDDEFHELGVEEKLYAVEDLVEERFGDTLGDF